MADFVALLRAVNVGGVKVAMADLRRLATGLGWRDLQTYVASGNLVFAADGGADDLAAALEGALATEYKRTVDVMILTGAQMQAALAACPFAPEEGRHVHAFFLWQAGHLDADRYAALRIPSEELVLHPGIAWLHAPEGIGRSKLAAGLDRVVTGTGMTARNLNTVTALAGMITARERLDGTGAG